MFTSFLSHQTEDGRLELLVDGVVYPTYIVCKAAYVFLDRGYFFFRKDGNNTIVQVTPKPNIFWSADTLMGEFSDELLSTLLRDMLERENKSIREKIIETALSSYVDESNFTKKKRISLDPQSIGENIDEIIQKLQQEDDFEIDEGEIERIMREIEQESIQKKPTLDPNKVKNAKEKFRPR